MITLNEDFKLTVAKEYTSLAIQNGLIREQDSSEQTAQQVVNFFRSVFENLDADITTT